MNATFNPWPEIVESDAFLSELRDYQDTARTRMRLNRPNLEDIIERACKIYGVTREQICSPCRKPQMAYARHYVCYYARLSCSAPSLPWIGKRLGGRDHSSVIYGACAHAIRHGLAAPWPMSQKRYGKIPFLGPEPGLPES